MRQARLAAVSVDGAPVEKRLGERYDARQENAKAIQHLGAFADLWKNADAELQPAVTAAKKRIAELTAQENH